MLVYSSASAFVSYSMVVFANVIAIESVIENMIEIVIVIATIEREKCHRSKSADRLLQRRPPWRAIVSCRVSSSRR